MSMDANDVSEIYSPPRIVEMAREFGLKAGFSLDLSCPEPNGYVWDFSKKECRKRARKKVNTEKPYMLIGSPHCGPWSSLQNLNMTTPEGRAKVEDMRKKEKVHLKFCVELYRHQMDCGRYFLHEHPQTAVSWKERCMVELMRSPLVLKATLHQCQFGQMSKDENGIGFAKKPTTLLMNSVGVHRQMDRQCTPGSHRHVHLMSGRAKKAQIYPPEMCRAVCRGVVSQMEMDRAGLASIKCIGTHVDNVDVELNALAQSPEDNDWMKFWDDTHGKELKR